MNILLTNDDGYDAPGLRAAHNALAELGSVHVVAPKAERSACGHSITLRGPITVERVTHPDFEHCFAVDGSPADCVRLAVAELIAPSLDLVVSGINYGANAGVDVFYSGTVAGAREGAIMGITSIAISQARRGGVETDWAAAGDFARFIAGELLNEKLPGIGFWNVNLPAPIPENARNSIRRVPVATQPTPMKFDRVNQTDGRIMQYEYGAAYWTRDVPTPTDYSTMREGHIAVSAIPLTGQF
ncbi:MAG: 5'/3'-nucleotidase SurE [Phycisphaerales bacterium]|nr:MAG: 5'/3'-nucleotidase SurE [Phycisphaerales bacterium]